MTEYYNQHGGKRRQRRSGNPQRSEQGVVMWLIDIVMMVITAGVAAVMALTFLVPYLNPARAWFLPVLGLAAPVTYILTLLLALYWVIRWRWWPASTMLALVIIGLFKLSLFYKPQLRHNYDKPLAARGTFSVMSYNVRWFYGPDDKSSVDDVVRMLEEHDPDIVCIQEFNTHLAGESARYGAWSEKYENARFVKADGTVVSPSEMVILSRYRILRTGVVLEPEVSVWADVMMGDDTVRVFNYHLHSTSITIDDGHYLADRRFFSDTLREQKLRSIVGRLRHTSVLRAGQVDTISLAVQKMPRRRIVCGDFNDTPMSYTYRKMARGLNDAFAECGRGFSHTVQGFADMLRIDYVLSSDDFETLTYQVVPLDCSDHHPVVVRLKKSLSNR